MSTHTATKPARANLENQHEDDHDNDHSTERPYIPPDPNPIKISDADQELIHDWFVGNDSLAEVAIAHRLSVLELYRWANRPEIAKILEALKELHDQRFKLKASAHAYDALTTLHFIASTESPTSAQEIARRAATRIIALANPTKGDTTPTPGATTPGRTGPRVVVKATTTEPVPEPVTQPVTEPKTDPAPHPLNQPVTQPTQRPTPITATQPSSPTPPSLHTRTPVRTLAPSPALSPAPSPTPTPPPTHLHLLTPSPAPP